MNIRTTNMLILHVQIYSFSCYFRHIDVHLIVVTRARVTTTYVTVSAKTEHVRAW